MESLNKEEYEAKDRAFYSAMISAWLNTKIERDKQLLGLSSTAKGLLVTLLRTTGVSNYIQISLFSFALFFFLITVIAVVCILDRNAKYIQEMLKQNKAQDKILIILDYVAIISFILGIILVVIIGVSSADMESKEKNLTMSNTKRINIDYQVNKEDKKSWTGISELRPQPPKAPQESPKTPNNPNPPTYSGSNESGNSNNTTNNCY